MANNTWRFQVRLFVLYKFKVAIERWVSKRGRIDDTLHENKNNIEKWLTLHHEDSKWFE